MSATTVVFAASRESRTDAAQEILSPTVSLPEIGRRAPCPNRRRNRIDGVADLKASPWPLLLKGLLAWAFLPPLRHLLPRSTSVSKREIVSKGEDVSAGPCGAPPILMARPRAQGSLQMADAGSRPPARTYASRACGPGRRPQFRVAFSAPYERRPL